MSKKTKNNIIFGVVTLVVTMVLTWGVYQIFGPDYTEEQLIEALNNNDDVTGKTVKFEIKSIDENDMTGWTMTSEHDVLFINGAPTDDEVGDTIIVEVENSGLAFGTWIVTTK